MKNHDNVGSPVSIVAHDCLAVCASELRIRLLFVAGSLLKKLGAFRYDIPRLLAAMAVLTSLASALIAQQVAPHESGPQKSNERWIQQGVAGETRPVWGHRDGIRIGLAPLPGPRGLLRVYTPYLNQPAELPMNYIAVEPIPRGEANRGLSELEFSRLDNAPGKRFQAVNDIRDTENTWNKAASGVIERIDGVESLRIFVLVESFENRAHVYLRLTFRADRPHEVGIATFTQADSRALDYSVVTATMGNYARLRELQMATETVIAQQLWPDYRGNEFTPHARFELAQLKRLPNGGALVSVRPNESEPAKAEYAPGTRRHWRYIGKTAVQSWRMDTPNPKLVAQVNGRRVYWRSQSALPGGIAFENFELVTPFQSGDELWFSVEPVG